ncbi:M48 family metallopeptidase [Aquincola tertiaricarbonis]|uniref:M48 family metallopeptidase n=1 Tax=Aquincola tertiaricarbonis TaxID=391953 RepID=UPI0006971AA4|nr:M48 family metallopeptidase [Aquincola tertiaricarbonis]
MTAPLRPDDIGPGRTMDVRYFDGRSARAHAARACIQGRALLVLPGAGAGADAGFEPVKVPLADVRWSERQRHGPRQAELPGGASLQAADAAAWDAWRRGAGATDSLVVRAQQSWRGVVLAGLLLIAGGVAGYLWGLPLGAQAAVAVLPHAVDEQVGQKLMATLDAELFEPSRLPDGARRRWLDRFQRAATSAHAPQAPPPHRVLFRHSPKLGANALALPGGTIVFTDALVQRFERDRDQGEPVLVGVFAHELGHVAHRHGMRSLVQASVLVVAGSLLIGDISSVAGALSVGLAQLGYSRDFEREADADAIHAMQADGLDPAQMARLFEALREDAPGAPMTLLRIALASHPDDAERVRRFTEAGRLK